MFITISESSLINIINEHCLCGGRGPNDNLCDACSIWHEINRVATKDIFQQVVEPDLEKLGFLP